MLNSLKRNIEELKEKAEELSKSAKKIQNAVDKIIPCINEVLINKLNNLTIDNIDGDIEIKGDIRKKDLPLSDVAYFHNNQEAQQILKNKILTVLKKYDYIRDFSLNFYLTFPPMATGQEGYVSFRFIMEVN